MDSERDDKMLAQASNNFALDIPSDTPGERCAYFLRLMYQDAKAKRIARDYEVSEPTARLWLSGKLPTSEHLTKLSRRHGWRAVAFIFGQMPLQIRLDAQREVLTAQLHAQEQDHAVMAGAQNESHSPKVGEVSSEPGPVLEADRGPTDRRKP
jgi:hypothetical protein